jgi:hypothetical protein
MTRFTVTWSTYAEGQLANVYMAASEPNEVTAAAYAIDMELGTDPEAKGSAWKPGIRILDKPPLSVLFTVHERDRVVRVISVRLLSPPSLTSPRNGPPSSGSPA